MRIIGNDWDDILKDEFSSEYYKNIRLFLDEAYKTKTIYPKASDLYKALRLTSYKDTKVVILGQDPYHEYNQACGLAFSVNKGVKIPPSLINIYKEIHDELNTPIPNHGDLTKWAKEGVLLLNTTLTVEEHKANSHQYIGWDKLTDAIIKALNNKDDIVVYLLWGNNAKKKEIYLNNPKQLVLKASHPSPLSAYNGFFKCNHFKKTNDFLIQNGIKEIDWSID